MIRLRCNLALAFLLVASSAAVAQYAGPTTVYTGSYQTYTYTISSGAFVNPVWTVSKGFVEDSYVSADRLVAYVSVTWTTTGAGYVKVTDGSINPANYAVTVSGCPSLGSPTAPTVPTITCAGNTVTLTSTPGSNGNTVQWFATATSTPALSTGNTFASPGLTANTTYYLASAISGTTCVGSRISVTVTVNPTPAPPPSLNLCKAFVYDHGSIVLVSENAQPGNVIRWYANATTTTYLAEGTTYTTPDITSYTEYYAAERNSIGCESTPRTKVVPRILPLIVPGKKKTEVIRVEGKKQDNQLYELTNTEKTTAFAHYDGAGRAMQQVVLKASPSGKDLIQFATFNGNGHTKSYLPYTYNTDPTGAFRSPATAATQQAAFYNTPTDNVADDTKPFTEAIFEQSPLARVLDAGGIGSAFTNHTATYNYSYNSGSTNSEAEEVRLFNSDGTSSGFYTANTLSRAEGTDADGNKQIVFIDASGQVIVKKKQLDEIVVNGSSTVVNFGQTYYIYDDFGRLKYIISPKGVAALKANSWTLSANILKAYVYQFVYDKRGRLVEKKVPGQAWMYYGYDRLNRLVLAQDSLLRGANKWTFVKYDKKGRTIMQGLYTNTTHTTRSAIQTNVLDPLYANSTDLYFEARGTAQEGYTNQSFPTTSTEVWSVSYYDSYDTNYDLIDDPEGSYTAQGLANELPAVTPYNMLTASKRIILGTTTWLRTYVFYDKFGRVIQVKGNNQMRATVDNVQTSVFDFEGKLLTSKAYHNTGVSASTPVTAILKYTYDTPTQTRLVSIEQSLDNGANFQEVVNYTYNELGQLVDKKLHKTGTNTYLQSVDYRYTIRGQLKSINNSQLNVDNSNDDTNDYFGMELLYSDTDAALSNTALYNGNASAIKWKALGMGSNASGQRSYTFAYDKTGQLKTASYKAHNGTNWSAEAGAQDETMAYDLNGNIRKLVRHQRKYQWLNLIASYKTETIDSLIYTYSTTFGDRLLKVEEAATANPLAGFNNGSTGSSTDYTYDNNGNLTADQNKTITSITYNYLNKPATILFTDGRKVEYVYDGSGTKLTMKTYKAGAVLKTTTQYVGSFLYENDTLRFFGSPEGRVIYKTGTFEYQYAIGDHQGNTRVLFSSAAPNNDVTTQTFESVATGNYPGGGFVSSFKNYTPSGSKSLLLTGGNNNMVGLGKSFYVYPGDSLRISAKALFKYPTGSNPSSLASFATYLLNAFALGTPAGGEAGTPSSAINNFGGWAAGGFGNGSTDETNPQAFITILLFDKKFNFLEVAYQQVTGSEDSWKHINKTVKAKEEGYAYIYVSNENETLVDVYFDDVTIAYKPTALVQYNEYYPFGMQTNSSWTRTGTKNNFLYDAGGELNSTTGFYDLAYRNYDAAVGRFFQVDPLAAQYHGLTPYNYANNSPVLTNDPNGALPVSMDQLNENFQMKKQESAIMQQILGGTYYVDWSNSYWGGSTSKGGGGGYQGIQMLMQMHRDAGSLSPEEYVAKYGERANIYKCYVDNYTVSSYKDGDEDVYLFNFTGSDYIGWKIVGSSGRVFDFVYATQGGSPFGFQDFGELSEEELIRLFRENFIKEFYNPLLDGIGNGSIASPTQITKYIQEFQFNSIPPKSGPFYLAPTSGRLDVTWPSGEVTQQVLFDNKAVYPGYLGKITNGTLSGLGLFEVNYPTGAKIEFSFTLEGRRYN